MIAVGALAVLYVVFAAASKPEQGAGWMRYASGSMQKLAVLDAPPPMPTRVLRAPDGGETSLQAFEGEIVLVNLWATSCAPCVHEMPSLAALQRRFEGRVRVIPISVDREADRERARVMLADLSGGSLPFYMDYTAGVLFDVRAPGMPVTILYSRSGQELARLAGGADWNTEEAAALMEAALARP